MPLRAHYIQHVWFEGPGSIATWLGARHATVTSTQVYRDARWPALDSFDWLIVLGGPMSVNEEGFYPWLAPEKRFLREAIEAGRPVLGICLGAQLLASALGASVRPNPQPEIGWWPIVPVPSHSPSPFAPLFDDPIEAFHWHGETYDLPDGAVWLARSAACSQQAFSHGERVLGLQCHFETTPDAARMLIDQCGDALGPGRWIQPASELLRVPRRFDQIHKAMNRVLDRFATAD